MKKIKILIVTIVALCLVGGIATPRIIKQQNIVKQNAEQKQNEEPKRDTEQKQNEELKRDTEKKQNAESKQGTEHKKQRKRKKGADKVSVQRINPDKKQIVEVNDQTTASFDSALTIENFSEKATDVIKGKISKIEYITYGETPWTILNVKVQNTLKGICKKGDDILVYELGGYIKYADFKEDYWELPGDYTDDTLIEMKYFQAALHQLGEEGVYFLTSDVKNLAFAQKGYQLVGSSFSILTLDKEDNKYVERKNDSNEEESEHTLKEIKEIVN